jgi:ribonuclease Z
MWPGSPGPRCFSRVTCGAFTASKLAKYKVAELRDMCDERGLPTQGTKPLLVERLLEDQGKQHAGGEGNSSVHAPSYAGTDMQKTRDTNREGSSNSGAVGASEQQAERQKYSITWLGTSSGAPTSRRNVSSMALKLDNDNIVLVDCGEGTRNQLRSAKMSPAQVSHIFVTHMHGDHCFGIAGMLLAIMNARHGTDREKEPVHIYGPPELHRLVAASCKAAQMKLRMPVIVTGFTLDPKKEVHPPRAIIANEPNYMVALQAPDQKLKMGAREKRLAEELQRAYESGSDQIVQNGLTWSVPVLEDNFNVKVTSAQLQHRMPCWGYVFENTEDHRKIVLLGDTCNSEAIARAAQGCDVLSHEATYKVGMEEKAKIATHSTSAQAGSFANRVRAKALVLTHFSARYDQVDKYKKMFVAAREKGMSVGDFQSNNVSALQDEARETAGPGCKVYLANDFYTYVVR